MMNEEKMTIGLMVSGNLGLLCLQELIRNEMPVVCVFTDRGSSSIIDYAKKSNLNCFVGNPRNGKALAFIGNHPIDVLLSVNYLFLVEEDIIQWPKVIAINFHGSLLPKYRGRTPHVWAIINGENNCGVTGHVMVKDCDAGDIVIQKQIEIDENTTGGQILEKFNVVYPEMVKEVYLMVLNNTLTLVPQDESEVSYFEKRTPDDGLIQWEWDMQKIKNWVRAQAYPYPGAFTIFNGNRVVIDRVEMVSFNCKEEYPNGYILETNPRLMVKVSDGAVELVKLRNPELRFKVGDVLGA
jgi:methionyl-tRNA formyltransferase